MTDNGDPREALRGRLDELVAQRDALDTQRDALEDEIARYKAALAALDGEAPARRRSSGTARTAVRAALATFDAPVRSTALMDHESLVHYSRHTLRTALADLHHAGEIKGERAPKGYIWDPRSVKL